MTQPIVLAFSGGLDTCAILVWLKETYKADVVAYCADLGNVENMDAVRDRALTLGAKEFICEDLQQDFLVDYVWPALKAGATYQKDYLLGTAVARPLIASRMAKVAKQKNASMIVHGATGKGNDQIRFEKTWSYLVPDIPILAPWKVWSFRGRTDLINYLGSKGISFDFPNKTFSIDENLFHVSYEGGPLEHLEENYLNALPHLAPKRQTTMDVSLTFESGVLTEINGPASVNAKRDPVIAMERLNAWGSELAIGIEDIVEERYNGIKSRGVYVTPGGTILSKALTQLKQICWDKDTFALSHNLAATYGEMVYAGDWFSPAKKALDGFFKAAAESLSGTVSLRLHPNAVTVTGRSSSYSLYRQDLVSFDQDKDGVNQAAKGFCDTLNYKCKVRGLIESANQGQDPVILSKAKDLANGASL